MKNKVLWGVKKGDQSWEEQIIVDTTDDAKIEVCKEWAKNNGFKSLRVSIMKYGDKPDFSRCVNTRI